jgi:hypothetical protein
MTDAATISAGLQSLKAAFDIGKALLNLSLSAQIQDRIREMNDRILAAQESAIASRDYQSALLQQIGNLEKQITDLEAWNAEAETYELTNVREPNNPAGPAFAYAPKKGAHTAEPPHFICAQCYEERHKSILQREMFHLGGCQVLICNRCSAMLYVIGYRRKEHPQVAMTRQHS